MPATYRVGVIGHTGRGNYGHGLDRVWLDVPGCEIVAVADAHEEGRAKTAAALKAPQAFADYRQMLDQARLDIVAIGPRWLDQHCDMVVAAAERGVHIYCEKPLCRTVAEADEMIAACERQQVKFAIAHQTRYSPVLPAIQDVIFDGKLGRVLEIRGRGKEDRRGGGEDLWVLGSHVMNLLHYFGGEPAWCFAQVLVQNRQATQADIVAGAEGIGPLAGDRIDAMYGLDQGVRAYFSSQRDASPQGRRFGIQIYGSEGIIAVDFGFLPKAYFLADPSWSPGASGARWTPITSAGLGEPEPLTDGSLHAGNVAAVRDLLSAIADDRLPECNIYDARLTVEMVAAVFASHGAGKPVPWPLAARGQPLDRWP